MCVFLCARRKQFGKKTREESRHNPWKYIWKRSLEDFRVLTEYCYFLLIQGHGILCLWIRLEPNKYDMRLLSVDFHQDWRCTVPQVAVPAFYWWCNTLVVGKSWQFVVSLKLPDCCQCQLPVWCQSVVSVVPGVLPVRTNFREKKADVFFLVISSLHCRLTIPSDLRNMFSNRSGVLDAGWGPPNPHATPLNGFRH